MNDLLSRVLELQHAAHELMYLGMDGEPIYSDHFCRLNKEILVKSDSLYLSKSADLEEEANLCLALLMGYNATIYDNGDKEQKKQAILDRIYTVLEHLPTSLLKVRLMTYCYGEIYEESMLQEARAIISTWQNEELTPGQKEIIKELENIEENPYPWEDMAGDAQ